MPNVTVIPATRNLHTGVRNDAVAKRKTAGYARVSTDSEEQLTSYEAQVDYYTNYIKSRPEWEFVNVYTDEGISATDTRHRSGFNQMVQDALDGKIDLIVTKSVSRFARNTVDSLTTVRKLKEKGVEVYFQKENIYTLDSKGELLITIMSSLAQEESRSISENVTWGKRKRFADGKVSLAYSSFLGYRKGEDGQMEIVPEEAETVRLIYRLFMQGQTPYAIAKYLTDRNIPTPTGKETWRHRTVENILSNEKYKGDALLQKVYTTDFLSKKKKKNEGEVPQYYVEGNHEAIIPPAIFDNVQVLMQSRGRGSSRNSCVSIFSSKIRCGDCGSWYGSKVWHSNYKYRKVVWQCNHKFDGGEKCTTPHLDEETVRQLFIKAQNTINREKTRILAGFEEIRDTAFETGELEAEERQLNREMNVAAELIQKCIGENARVAQNQGEYAKRYDALVGRFETAKARLEEVQAAITEKQAQRKMMENFMEVLRGLPEQVDYFDEAAWYAMVDFVTVYGKEDVRITFKNGMEISV